MAKKNKNVIKFGEAPKETSTSEPNEIDKATFELSVDDYIIYIKVNGTDIIVGNTRQFCDHDIDALKRFAWKAYNNFDDYQRHMWNDTRWG